MANFYRSENGQTLLSGNPETLEYTKTYALYKAGPGAPFLAREDALLEKVNKPIQDQMGRIEHMFSVRRVAEFVARSDLIHFEDESRRKAIVDELLNLN